MIKETDDVITDFIANQEPLGEEFAKVLHDNLWELYVDDTPLTEECEDPDKKIN